jgi:hypothetical protein
MKVAVPDDDRCAAPPLACFAKLAAHEVTEFPASD